MDGQRMTEAIAAPLPAGIIVQRKLLPWHRSRTRKGDQIRHTAPNFHEDRRPLSELRSAERAVRPAGSAPCHRIQRISSVQDAPRSDEFAECLGVKSQVLLPFGEQ